MGAIMNVISKAVGGFTNWGPMQKSARSFKADAERALGAAVVTSMVVKDGIGCVMYVTQSLHNEKIPEEKRKFVAALDLTNGVLMIATQIVMFLASRKYSGKIFNKLFNSSFNPIAQNNAISKFRMKADQLGETVYKKLVGGKKYNEFKDGAASVFKFCLDTASAAILAKRVIVPLIATPLASKVKKWMDKRDAQNGVAETKQSQEPSMQGSEKKAETEHKLDTGSTNLLEKFKQK